MGKLWEVIDTKLDKDAGVISHDGKEFRYDGNDVDLEDIVHRLGTSRLDEVPDKISIESRGAYIAVPEEDPEDEEVSSLAESLTKVQTELPEDENKEDQAPIEDGWVAQILNEAGKPLGQIVGANSGKLEFEIDDAIFQSLLMLDVIPALESVSMTPVHKEYPEALKKTIESLKDKKYRVELREMLSVREAFGGDTPNAVVRWGSNSPQWGGPAAPWAPVPLGQVRDFVRQNPDAALEINFPTVFEEDRSAKVKDILAGDASGFISHRRSSEQYAKEMGFEQFDYDQEQDEISREKPKDALPPDMKGNSTLAKSMGSTIGGHLGNAGGTPAPPGGSNPVQSELADAPGQGRSRGQWSADDSSGQHSYKMDMRLAELAESIKNLEAFEKETKRQLKETKKEARRVDRQLREAQIAREARAGAFAEAAAQPSTTTINVPEREVKVEVHPADVKPADVKVEVHPPAVQVQPANVKVDVALPPPTEREFKYDSEGKIIRAIDHPRT